MITNISPLLLSSCMAGNMDYIGRLLAPYLAEKLGLSTRYVDDVPWQERERRFDRGEIQVLWICGLPYIQKAADPNAHVALLAAPVMAGERYEGRPVYFSDIVVRSSSPYHQFDDLRGATWAYNEPNSHSGHTTIRYYLARRNEGPDFFGRVVESGSHENSINMILEGLIDGSAIDSTVLELEQIKRPALAGELRILDTIGPSPIPPWLVDSHLAPELRRELRRIFCTMHHDPQGNEILRQARFSCFVPVSDSDYDPLRKMTADAALVEFPAK
ncbi:MAG: PhnD/SsuA/transferrin family substrate-binding protein [Candidatus Promineifilaceae bacterium]